MSINEARSQIAAESANSDGGGGMAARIHAFDWSRTPLGPMDRWPQSLRTAVSICLGSRFPMMLWWGPDLINIYNDAFVPVLGGWHPRRSACPAATCGPTRGRSSGLRWRR